MNRVLIALSIIALATPAFAAGKDKPLRSCCTAGQMPFMKSPQPFVPPTTVTTERVRTIVGKNKTFQVLTDRLGNQHLTWIFYGIKPGSDHTYYVNCNKPSDEDERKACLLLPKKS